MELSLTRALSEKKMLTKRLDDKIVSGIYVSVTIGDADKPADNKFSTKDELNSMIKSSYDSVEGLLTRYRNITKAIIHSNSSTIVNICGNEMTVAEAIERKKSIKFEEKMLMRLKDQFRDVTYIISSDNNSMESGIDDLVKSALSADKNAGKNEDYVKSVDKSRRSILERHLADPCKINQQIDAYRESIENFNNEVDFVLSESNAKTMISIPD